ncbi:MAG: C10 family peptidase, partial [Candidatus Cloacimonetes bacterium]|nr:C10 family peptidase [Candidatus Cloacimonadota bacterium]
MKNKTKLLLIAILLFGFSLFAKQMEFNSCKIIANKKLSQLGKSNDFSIIRSDEILNQNNENVLFCVFELQPKGYIVTTVENDLPPIIAYSFTSNFYDEESGNILLEMLKTDIPLRLVNISNLPEGVISNRNELWIELLNENIETSRFEQWPPEGTTPTGGWLLDNWSQSSPYNNLCPMDPVTGSRSVAGCPSIAMAQILNYHRTVNSVSFDDADDYYHNYAGRQYWIDDDHLLQDFPSFPELNVYLDTLAFHYLYETPVTNTDKAALVFACGVAAQQVYTSQGSGTFGVNQAYQAFLKFNFNGVQLIDETTPDFYEQLAQNMMDALPVHFASVTPPWDAGHNFVVDGYNTDEYYHLNMGWGGSYNGWYLLPDEIPYGLT